jgi:hypothetical protein
VHRLLGGPALAVDGGRGDGLGQARRERAPTGDVRRLLADLVDAAGDDVVDALGVDAGAVHDGPDAVCEGVDRMDGCKRALAHLALSDRGPDRLDDDRFVHGFVLVSLKFKPTPPSIAGHGRSHEAIRAVHVSPAAGTTRRCA